MHNKHEIANGRNPRVSLSCLASAGPTNLSDIILHLSLTAAFGTLTYFLFFKFTNFFPVLGPLYLYSPWQAPYYPGLDAEDTFSERPSLNTQSNTSLIVP